MPVEAALLLAAALGTAVAYFSTPIAIRVAERLEFYDRPQGYKGHGRPTPYLGGAAVMAGFLVAVALFTDDGERTLPVLAGAVVLWAIGTLDDRRTVSPLVRVVVEAGIALWLWILGFGWDLGLGGAVDAGLTVLWIVAVVNAFNLFDNMDGAAGTMGCVTAAGLAALGLVRDDPWLVAMSAALSGACLGFLPHNLARPSRIFLGDGGSMPVGFAVAALAMVGASDAAPAWQALAMGLLLVGIPALDTCLVVISRARRGIPLLTGGRDHLTHRTRGRLRTARAVALALGGAQAVLGALAILAANGGSQAFVFSVLVYVVAVGTTITLLDGRPGAASADLQHGALPTRLGFRGPAKSLGGGLRPSRVVLAILLPVAVGLTAGLSLFADGFYDSSAWVPAALVTLTVLVAAALAQRATLTGAGWAALLGLAGLAAWSMLSALWADSAAQALVEANRLIFYAGLLGLLLLLVRDARTAILALGGLAGGVLTVGLWLTGRIVLGDADAVLLGGRLHEPLGYINVQGGVLCMAVFPLLAVAERHGRAAPRGAAAAAATLLAGLAFLSESRGVMIAGVAAVLVVVLLVPGRARRIGLIALMAAGLAAAVPALIDLYEAGVPGPPDAGVSTRAGISLVIAAALVGAAWSALTSVAVRLPPALDRRRGRAARVAGIAVAAAILMIGGLNAGRIADRVDSQYRAFVNLGGPDQADGAGTRLFSGGGSRYDYWRVAVATFRGDPVVGVGAGNYEQPYLALRRTNENVRQPHSLHLQVLAELGLVGALLLAATLAAVVVAVVRRRRAASDSALELGLLLAATGVASMWFVQASVDWIHLVPGATIAALIAVAVLLRPTGAPAAAPAGRWSAARGLPALRIVATATLAAFVVVGGVSLSRQLLAERYADQAREALADGRAADALTAADRSLRLDSETVDTYYLKAAALARFNEPDAAQSVLTQAAKVEPGDFLTYVLLGDLAVRRGDTERARVLYGYAQVLNPRDSSAPEGIVPAPPLRSPLE